MEYPRVSRLDRNVLHVNSLEMSSAADLIQVMSGYGGKSGC